MKRKIPQPGLDQRHRDEDGKIRRKNGNTILRTLRRIYGEDFASAFRSDTKLGTLLERTETESLSQLIKKSR